MKKRVSSTVTKRKANPRPRKYASASERQAAYRARAPEVCFRAEQKTVETLDRIAETLDQSRADVLLSMTKFALANHDWARFGLTHKPLPFEYGVNPIMATKKRKPTPAQLAARERFAEMARSGGFKKAGGRKANPMSGDRRAAAEAVREATVQRTNANSAMVWQIIGPNGEVLSGPPGVYPGREGPLSGSATMGQRGWKTKREANAALAHLNRKADEILGLKSNPACKAAGVRRNPSSWGTAPLKKVRSVIARSKTTGERRTFMMADSSGVKVPTPYDFGFRLEIEGEMFDFVGRYEGPLLIISEKSTGLRLPGDVGFTLRSSYGDDKNAAKRWTLDLIERVTPQKFAQKVRAAR